MATTNQKNMPSKPSSSDFGGACDAFMEALDGYISGLISLERLRVTTSLLLEGNFGAAEEMQAALDSTLREGYLEPSAHRVMTTLIELVTSEEEPTESPRHIVDLSGRRVIPIEDWTAECDDAHIASELAPGMTLRDRFTLVEQIDSGSMGRVFKAIDRRKEESGADNPWVAIKSITEIVSNPPDALTALQKEASTAQQLSHPNIIRVFDFDRDGDHVFMTMELLDGMSLAELLNRHRFRPYPVEEARAIIEGICHGLVYAHDRGIVHADVKPGNVFITSDNNTKLLDFGISVSVSEDPDEPEIYAHTPSYASCEVLEGEAPTAQDDVYSLACVAYRLLAGQRVFGGATAVEAEKQRLQPEPLENIAEHEWKALRHALAFRRADRTPDVASFLDELSCESTDEAPMLDDEFSAPERSAARRRHIPAVWLGAAASVAAIAVAFGPRVGDERGPEPAVDAPNAAMLLPDNPADVGPPVEYRTSADTDKTGAVVATPDPGAEAPPRRAPKPDPIRKYAVAANASMDAGDLLTPAENNARFYISKMLAVDPEAAELGETRRRFADLMMLEVMLAITEEDFTAAESLIAETKAVGVGDDVTLRYEKSLQKARDDKQARESESLAAIFASAAPAAILTGTDDMHLHVDDLFPDAASEEAAIFDTSTAVQESPDGPGETAHARRDMPAEPPDEALPEILPLSAFEFTRHVQPKFPRLAADRSQSGWVDLKFLVNAEGRTENIEVMDSEPRGRFEKAATRAISKWRFKPMIVDGEPVAKTSIVRLRFAAQ